MKNVSIILSILIVLSCNREDDTLSTNVAAQNVVTLVAPIQTNTNYSSAEKEHYVVRNNQLHINKLLLFMGGSFSTPKNYDRVCDHAASLGFDVISLSYFNNVAAAPLGSSSDPFIFDNYRDEICFGNQVSNAVDVDVLNAINSRTVNLLQYLNLEYPNQNWKQYLTSSNTLIWEKIIVSGHSQGSGHACFLGKQNSVNKVIMFSGPNDYSTFFNEPANWLTQSGATALDKHFSLLHVEDNILAFDNQVSNLKGLGLLSSTEDPILVDDLASPYSKANSLSLNITAISNHNSTIGANSIVPDIWTYMLTSD